MPKAKKMQLTLASGVTDPASATKLLKDSGAQFKACVDTILSDLEEPLKAKWSEAISNMEKALASLPSEAAKPEESADNTAAWAANLNVATAVISQLQTNLKTATDQLQATLAGLPAKIQEAVEAKVKSGDFITKDAHATAINDATATATKAARDAVTAEAAVLTSRKAVLTTASLPVPADSVLLAGDDTAFTAAQATAAKRAEELKPFGLEAERVLTLCWGTPDADYQSTLALMTKVAEHAKKAASPAAAGAPANGFINRTPEGGNKFTATAGLC